MSARGFPVLLAPEGCPATVAWSSLDESHAQQTHGQTLAQLARRGGLTPCEVFANVRRVAFACVNEADALDLVRRIAHES